jgi:hypothetical protein
MRWNKQTNRCVWRIRNQEQDVFTVVIIKASAARADVKNWYRGNKKVRISYQLCPQNGEQSWAGHSANTPSSVDETPKGYGKFREHQGIRVVSVSLALWMHQTNKQNKLRGP